MGSNVHSFNSVQYVQCVHVYSFLSVQCVHVYSFLPVQCVHRDLAARNVLIADNFLIKICDFGLARETGDSAYYRSKTPRPLPARWMAVETLTTGIHTPKSDV